MLDKVGQQIEDPRLELYQPPSLAQLIVCKVERVGIKGVQHRRSLSSYTLGRCDQSRVAHRTTSPHCYVQAVLQQSSANLQPIFSQSSANLQPIFSQSSANFQAALWHTSYCYE